ncbi:MAG: ribosome recycling factor [Bacteroidales bacterium]|nr:ribosome recycling factor [Bacteroidales bacterium]
MEEEAVLCIDIAREKMDKAIRHLEEELMRIRAGKATPNILDGIHIEYYGASTPLSQVSNIGTPDAKTVVIQPWDKSMLDTIEKAILYANIGLTPMNNGEIIRLNIPPLTEERRRDLVKQVRSMGENTKVSIRNARRDANDELKKLQKQGLSEDVEKEKVDEVQKMTDEYSSKVDVIVAGKEKDIMTV